MVIELKAIKGMALTVAYPACDGEWSSQYVTAPAALDSEISKDKENFVDCYNEWTEIQTSGIGTLALTATEMTADLVVVKTTSSTAGINFPLIVIYTELSLDSANTELAAVPTSTANLRAMIQHIFEKIRHKETFDKNTGVSTLYKDDGTTSLGTSTSTDDGTVITRGEMT